MTWKVTNSSFPFFGISHTTQPFYPHLFCYLNSKLGFLQKTFILEKINNSKQCNFCKVRESNQEFKLFAKTYQRGSEANIGRPEGLTEFVSYKVHSEQEIFLDRKLEILESVEFNFPKTKFEIVVLGMKVLILTKIVNFPAKKLD